MQCAGVYIRAAWVCKRRFGPFVVLMRDKGAAYFFMAAYGRVMASYAPIFRRMFTTPSMAAMVMS